MTNAEETWTERLLEAGDDVVTTPIELLKLLRQWIEAGTIKGLLFDILRDADALRRVQDQSFLHPLGVWKIVLLTSGPTGLELRIHFWDKDSKPDHGWSDYLHSHKWSFASQILFGEFETSIFSRDVPGPKCRQKELVTSGVGSERAMRTIDMFDMGEALRTKMSPGDSYFLHASAIHSIEPLNPLPAATMMLRGKYVSDTSNVFSFSNEDDHNEAQRRTTPISKEKVRIVLERTLETMRV